MTPTALPDYDVSGGIGLKKTRKKPINPLEGSVAHDICEISKAIEELSGSGSVKFRDLQRICDRFFEFRGEHGSHRTYKTPWEGDPRVNIQKDGKDAKRYQVKQVCRALERLRSELVGG